MTKEDYVSLEVAKLLKEKGFDYATLYYYEKNGKLGMMNLDAQSQMRKHGYMNDIYPRPTLYETGKWLRNKYDINVAVNAVIPMWFDRKPKNSDTLYMPSITHKNVDGKIEMLMFRNLNDFNYEKVYNNGILEALKLI